MVSGRVWGRIKRSAWFIHSRDSRITMRGTLRNAMSSFFVSTVLPEQRSFSIQMCQGQSIPNDQTKGGMATAHFLGRTKLSSTAKIHHLFRRKICHKALKANSSFLFAPWLTPSRHVSALAAVHTATGGVGAAAPSTPILLVHRGDESVSGRHLSDAAWDHLAEVDDDDDVAPRRQVPSMAVASIRFE